MYKPPRGAYIRRGDLTEGFLRYDFEGLIFGILRYLIPLRGMLSQPGIWVGVCHGHPGSLSPFVYNVGSNL